MITLVISRLLKSGKRQRDYPEGEVEVLRGGIPIGKVRGISIRLHYSWFLIFALITWLLAGVYFPEVFPHWSLSLRIGAGLLTSFLFFGSVLVHELMHSLVALREGIPIRAITLFFLGGVSQMAGEPKTAGDEFRMAIAGPLTSLVLGGIFLGIFFGLQSLSGTAAEFGIGVTYYLGFINILLGLFNLIPGFPLDGGRVLRSLLWWRGRNLRNATRVASNIGRGVGFLFIVGGIFLIFIGSFFNGIWLILVGWFLESAAAGSYQQVVVQDMLKGHLASEIMSRDCVMVPPEITIEQLVNEKILTSGRRCFPVAVYGHTEGLITLQDIRTIDREQWDRKLVRDAMIPKENLKSVRQDEDLTKVLEIMTQNDINQVPVLDEQGNVVGMIGRDNILNFIKTRAELEK